jgi:hypothetical protein
VGRVEPNGSAARPASFRWKAHSFALHSTVVAALVLVVGRISKTLLYGIAPLGLSTLGSPAIVLVVSSALPAAVPARLANSLDLSTALRRE